MGDSGRMDATQGNSERHLCLPWRTWDCPTLGQGAICSWMQKLPAFWCKMTSKLFLERQRGGPPGWVPSGGGGRGLVALLPLPASTALVPLPRCPTCGFTGILGRIPMNRELLSPREQLPSPAITPPSVPRERDRQARDTQLALLHKFNNNKKTVSVNWKKMLSNTGNN